MRDDDLLLTTPGLEFGSGVIGPCDICGRRQAVIVLTKERYQLCVIDFLNKSWTGSKAKPGSPMPPYRSERVTFPTDVFPSGEAAGILLSPTKAVRRPVVLITPEVYGITTSLLDAGIHLARAGFEVLIPDVAKTALLGPADHLTSRFALRTKGGVPVTTPRVAKLVRFYSDALVYLRGREMVVADKSAVFGLSYGGALALAVAAQDQKLGAVAVAYPVAVSPPDILNLVTAKVFVVAGRKDRVASASRRQLERLPAGQVEFLSLTEVGHNYLSRDLRAYDQNRAEQSWAEIVGFLKRQLMPAPPRPPAPPTTPPAEALAAAAASANSAAPAKPVPAPPAPARGPLPTPG
jgi:dienelactone hydrolase